MTSFRHSLTIAATCALLLCAPAARAEPAPRSDRIWTLEDAKSAVLARSTLVAGIDARLAARLAEAADITRSHNPEVSAEFRAPSSRRERETEVEVSIGQPLRLSSSSLRSEVRMLLEKTASSEQRIEILELSQRTTELYTELWVQQEKTRALSKAHGRLTRTEAAVRKAAEQGLMSGGEAFFFAAQAAELHALQLRHKSECAAVRAGLIRLTGSPIPEASLSTPELPALPAPTEMLERAAAAKFSERGRLRLLERTAERQLQLAEREALPNITPRLVYEHADDGSDRFGAGITIPLPFYQRNQSEIARKRAELSNARARLSYNEEETFHTELLAMHRVAQAQAERTNTYSRQIVPKLRSAVSRQEAQFERGQGSVLQLWQMQQELLRAELEAIDARQSAIRARLALWPLLGEEF